MSPEVWRNERREEIAEQWRRVRDLAPAALIDLAIECNAVGTSVVPGDAHLTAVNEGKRLAFLHVARHLGVDHTSILNLLKG